MSVAYNTVANLSRLAISVLSEVRSLISVRFQYLVRLLSLSWSTSGHTIHPPIKGLFPPTGTEPIPLQNLTYKVAGACHYTHSTCILSMLLHNKKALLGYLFIRVGKSLEVKIWENCKNCNNSCKME